MRGSLTVVGFVALAMVLLGAPSASARRPSLGRHAIIRVLAPSTEACVADRFSATFEVVISEDAGHFPSPLWFACSQRRIVRADALLVVDTVPFRDATGTALEVHAPRTARRADLTQFDVLSLLGHPRAEIESIHGRGVDGALPGSVGDWANHRHGLGAQYQAQVCVAVRVPVSGDIPQGRLEAWLGLTTESAETVTITRSGTYAEVRAH